MLCVHIFKVYEISQFSKESGRWCEKKMFNMRGAIFNFNFQSKVYSSVEYKIFLTFLVIMNDIWRAQKKKGKCQFFY